MADWRKALLKSLGAPVTPSNLRFLSGWQRWEGGHTKNNARFNWLNTTRGPGTSINSVGVKAFGDFQTGIRYTAETLMNGRYDDIVAGLASGNPYSRDVSAGLQTWVSGRPDGNPAYARKVLGQPLGGGGGAPKAALYPGGRGPTGNPGLASPPPVFDFPDEFLWDIWGDLTPLFKATFGAGAGAGRGSRQRVAGSGPSAAGSGKVQRIGKGFMFPVIPKGTHVTDNLGWNTKTAQDIMDPPGTPIMAPMGGTVVSWKPEGAQGGGSMLIRLDNGYEYWLGHIANGAKAGTRFRKGQMLALVANQSVSAPHLHIDRRKRR